MRCNFLKVRQIAVLSPGGGERFTGKKKKRGIMTVHRRALLTGGAAATLSLAAGAVMRPGWTQSTGAPKKVVLRSTAASLTFVAQYVMEMYGYDKARGLDVDLQGQGTAGTITIDVVLARQADFGAAGTVNIMQAIRQGADLKIIGSIVNSPHMMVLRNEVAKKLGVSPDSPVTQRINALKGLTIATSPVGAAHYQILRAYLKQYQIDPDNDVRIVGVGDAAGMLAGLEQGRYDALAFATGSVEYAINAGFASVWISGPRGDVPGSDMSTAAIFARSEVIEQKAADADALRAAVDDALKKIRDDRKAVGDALHQKYFPKLDRALWDIAWNGAAGAYPETAVFTRQAYDYWAANDPKGADSYKNVSYEQMTYPKARS
jgi:NitT/TauT family transport system substrate-binding protein